ncbi:hypothetical protein QQ045_032626 [Rhodiola kirilowii]
MGSQRVANGAVADSNVSARETSNRKRRSPSEKDDEDYEDEDDSASDFVSIFSLQRILDMMDVEGLTRENVASHLQKYRMYLKRISNGGQPHMLGGLGGRNSML